MSKADVKTLFSPYITDTALLERFSSAQVESIEVNRKEAFLRSRLRLGAFMPFEDITLLEKAIQVGLCLNTVELLPIYPADSLTPACFPTIVSYLRRRCVAVNGTFNDAEYTLQNNEWTIRLKHGGLDVIESTHTDTMLKELIGELFETKVSLRFEGVAGVDQEDEQYKKLVAEAQKAEREAAQRAAEQQAAVMAKQAVPTTVKPQKPIDDSAPPADGLPIYLETATSVFGPIPRETPVALNQLQEGTVATVWGEVFGYETRAFKEGTRIRHTFYITDRTNSVSVILWTDTKRDKAKLEAMESVKNGSCVLLNGLYEYDSFAKGNVLAPKSLALVSKYVRKDTAEKKRVELHLHTKMSAMDAVSDAKALVQRAVDWGHSAIAITDHGVAQAFPEAMNAAEDAAKAGHDIKILYGVEAYYIPEASPRDENGEILPNEKTAPRYHQILLAKNNVGLKNLYKLISFGHLKNYRYRPRITKEKLLECREGLLIGSACEQGELFQAIIADKPWDELCEIARFYDFLEIQPLGNNHFMLRPTKNKDGSTNPPIARDEEQLREFNRTVIRLGDELGIPVCATCDVHFLDSEDEVYRRILQAGQGFGDADLQAPLYFRTT
ncbi:MAG: PHP domain-containing protein, partial [Clostridia bacterium]|nr:PHP domain-containing protein [Clostridia bacterium]